MSSRRRQSLSVLLLSLAWLPPIVAQEQGDTPAKRLEAALPCDEDPECDDASAWATFTHVVLRQWIPGAVEVVEWNAAFDHATLDASINTTMRGSSEPIEGTIALVGGQVMLSKGLEIEPGYEIDVLDAPVLNLRLLMILLSRVFPDGPAEVSGAMSIERTDDIGIKYATPSASGYLPAPWRVKGTVEKVSDGDLTFDLELTVHLEQEDKLDSAHTVRMSGRLGMLGRPVFLDADSLEGWTTYGIGPRKIEEGTSIILDFGATPDETGRYETIGDVRAYLAAENHPGQRDPTKDFTGFWKRECDQAFGLQIMHHGDEGEYSVVFCGPGGCGDASESRPTFITGDKGYEVVSEEELIMVSPSGERTTYYRCTRETRPVLKYRE